MRGPTEAEQLDAKIREVRGLLGDLKRATRDAEQVAERLEVVVTGTTRTVVEDVVEAEVRRGLESIQEAMGKAAGDAYDRVQGEVDRLMNIIRFGNAQGRGEDRLEQAAHVAHARGRGTHG